MARNEYGAILDSNGYAPSILQWDTGEECAFCKVHSVALARHEVFQGMNRRASKKYGLWLTVCPTCHRFIHNNPAAPDVIGLDKQAQQNAMTKYGWTTEEFIERFGKNYL